MKKILISGGTGLVGQRLSLMLLEQGYEVAYLSRKSHSRYKTFLWNPVNGEIDTTALEWADGVIHLAGAGLFDQRWTAAYKTLILESRKMGTRLLAEGIEKCNSKPEVFISASAIGYYGFDTGEKWVDERTSVGSDFISEICVSWEEETKASIEHTRTVLMRIGIVLSEMGGALEQMANPIRWFVGAPLGSGKQYVSWIHIDDLCKMFIFALENNGVNGVYNAVGVQPITQEVLTKAIAKRMNKPLWLPAVPGFVLEILLGEAAQAVLGGTRVKADKIKDAGFEFTYTKIEDALNSFEL